MISADNQQERLDALWIVGFVDGEGCFHVGFNKPRGYLQIIPEFRIVQHQRDVELLQKIKNFFGYGLVTTNHDDRKEFRVRGLQNLQYIVQFFRDHPLRTKKQNDFEKFACIIQMLSEKKHRTPEGLQTIISLASTMNRQKRVSRILKDYTLDTLKIE